MKIYLDTNVHCEIATAPDGDTIREAILSRGLEIVASEMLIEEVLLTRQPQLAAIGRSISTLLQGRNLYAPIKQQLDWSVLSFASDPRPTFEPFPCLDTPMLLRMASSKSPISEAIRNHLREQRESADDNWHTMHAEGRVAFQQALVAGEVFPNAGDWMAALLASDFTERAILGIVGPAYQGMLRGKMLDFLEWHTVARCFMEQFVLAVRRHGVLPRSESSNKGPRWHDYEQGAYVASVDTFVTDDERFRRALQEHRQLRADATWTVVDLATFTDWLRSAPSGQGTN